MEALLLLYIIVPLATAFLIPVLGRFLRSLSTWVTPVIFLLLLVMSVVSLKHSEPLVFAVGGWQPVNGIPIAIYLIKDGFSSVLLVIINLVAFLAAFYSVSYMRKYSGRNHFYALLCLMIAGMNGVVLTGDIFNLYVFLEIASIASYALVAFGVEKEELEASYKYQVLGGVASLLILLSIALLYWGTGTLNFSDISEQFSHGLPLRAGLFIQVLLITGFGMKAALVPFHAWLPDAHSSAPSPISALLSGVLIKAVGLYVLFRLLFNVFLVSYPIALTVLVLGVLSMVVGGFLAIVQSDYKRLLAYSSISQVGYIMLGIGVGMIVLASDGSREVAALAILGALFHMINHAVFKGLMFLVAGSVEHATGVRDLNKLGGLGARMPVTSGSSFFGAMGISGLPPFAGFFSKLIIILAAIQANYYFVAVLAALVSVVTLVYFLKMQKNIFYGIPVPHLKKVSEAPFFMQLPMIVLALLCLALSALLLPGVREVLLLPAVNCLLGSSGYNMVL